MSVRKSDWLYLIAGTAASWALITYERGGNPNLQALRWLLKLTWWAEKQIAEAKAYLLAEINRELDSWQ